MSPPYLRFRALRPLLSATAALSLAAFCLLGGRATQTASAQTTPPPFKNFEGPQVHPLALTPDGTRLLAVNTPNATLSVFQLASGAPVLTAEIPVGFEPVSVAVRANGREAWVANWMSDSVSIVDLATGNVTGTIDVGDEPTDVLFAGSSREMAFVCVSGGPSLLTPGVGVSNLGKGLVKVFDPANPSAGAQTINIFGKQPRALARNSDGSRVFVSVFESGNQTTIVSQSDVAANGGLPPPNPPLAPGLPAPPNTGLIVKWNGSQWVDELNRGWNSVIPYTLADVDIAVIDASGASLPSAVSAQVRGVGTHVGNMAFDPTGAQRLYVANLEDINQVRFEPNLSGRFQASRVTIVSAPAGATPTVTATPDLNPHVVDPLGPGSDAERALSLAMPGDIARQSSDGTVYVAATSSARVGVLDPSGAVLDRIAVGQGPTGLALDEARQQLYVLNRFDQTISVVNTASKQRVGSPVPVGFNIEPPSVRDGRRFLYDASLSAHGTVSCASCHLNGHRDGQAWDLGNPQGSIDTVNTVTGPAAAHPMKGPMVTQSLRGIIGNEPLHWRGDRAGLENFNGAFVSLLGSPRLLTDQEVAAFKAFVQSLTYPPNPNEPQFRPPANQSFFNNEPLDRGVVTCSSCHVVDNFRNGTNNTIIPKDLLQETQGFKVPQFRGLYQKVGMDKTPGEKLTGYGFAHDGTFDTLFNFQKAPQFDFKSAGDAATADSWRRSIELMILQLDTGTPPAVGLMVTVDASNKTSATARINLLASQAAAGNCDLVVRGLYGGSPRGFLRLPDGTFQPDTLSEAPVTLQTLLSAARAGAELTFMGVPAGEGRLFALDRDGNGVLNDDEPHTSVGLTGRVVDASGAGIAGVTVTLTGTQSAAAVTDATGRYAFNFLSTSGTHTVTPSRSGLAFAPTSRTFSSPSWNLSANFITASASNPNASDATQFYVAQHYLDFLARDPDAPGLQFWTNDIESCGADAPCREVHRVNVSAAFYLSIEFKETGGLVYRAYKASFGDLPGKPVPVTFQQLMTDTQRVGRNVVVNQGNWQQLLETNKQAFFQGWVRRPAFLAAYPAGMSAAQFVDTLNANTGGSLTQGERDALVNQLAANNTTAGRALVVRQVAENPTLQQREFNKAFVLMQYFGYLRRDPDSAPDTDFSGYISWLTKLNAFNGNFVQAEMVKAFITSTEYRQRFGQ